MQQQQVMPYSLDQQRYQMQQRQGQNQIVNHQMINDEHKRRIIADLEKDLDAEKGNERKQNVKMQQTYRVDEMNFFSMTELPDKKYSLLLFKNHCMDQILSHCNVRIHENDVEASGGRYIPKTPEPISPPQESPVIQEMRMMHVDFVEEAYWKRVAALKFAIECKKAIKQKRH